MSDKTHCMVPLKQQSFLYEQPTPVTCFAALAYTTTTTAISCPFVRFYPDEPLLEETFTHSHLSWSSTVLYQLPASTTIHSIFFALAYTRKGHDHIRWPILNYVNSMCTCEVQRVVLFWHMQTAAMHEAAAQAKKLRDREITKSKKPSTLKKVGSNIVITFSLEFSTASHTYNMVYAMAQCLSICHKPVFCRNGWTYWTGFGHKGYSRFYAALCFKRIWVIT